MQRGYINCAPTLCSGADCTFSRHEVNYQPRNGEFRVARCMCARARKLKRCDVTSIFSPSGYQFLRGASLLPHSNFSRFFRSSRRFWIGRSNLCLWENAEMFRLRIAKFTNVSTRRTGSIGTSLWRPLRFSAAGTADSRDRAINYNRCRGLNFCTCKSSRLVSRCILIAALLVPVM